VAERGGKAEAGRITARPGGGMQVAESGRKLFGKARRAVFLEWLAATCNVRRSAAAAEVTANCVYQRRMRDPAFRAEWQEALEQGYARLEARLLERVASEDRIAIAGDLEPADEPFDKELALHLLREHKKGLAGVPGRGAAPRAADWAEVEAHFVKRLGALRARLDRDAA
jgi:hypothetical protein